MADAIVADQQEHRRQLREHLRSQGIREHDLNRHLDAEFTDLRFDGDVIVADQPVMYDPEAIERISPDGEGRYVLMGWNWCWEAVPYACDRIAAAARAARLSPIEAIA